MNTAITIYEQPNEKLLETLLERPSKERAELEKIVSEIIETVKRDGDDALRIYAKRFDSADLDSVKIPEDMVEAATDALPVELKKAIDRAYRNIHAFHTAQRPISERVETEPGVLCWRAIRAIEKVGIYIPGGTAPLFSTVLMLAIPAKIAGCKEVVLSTPADSKGQINPAILYAAKISGVTTCIASGGAQAIAAMAYGTESVPKVDKIFGPGNQFVTKAKQIVSVDQVAIDMPAGPSEVLVIADESADPAIVASDLLSQAEHGADSQVILLTDSKSVAAAVILQIDEQLKRLERIEFAVSSLAHSSIIIVSDIKAAFDISNRYAPEHLIINIADADQWLDTIEHAGSVFIGAWTPESAGDYASGTNHTLPTSGWSRSFSGVSLDSYIKKITFQKITREGLQSIGPVIETMAAAEGLGAHKEAVTIRLKAIAEGEDNE